MSTKQEPWTYSQAHLMDTVTDLDYEPRVHWQSFVQMAAGAAAEAFGKEMSRWFLMQGLDPDVLDDPKVRDSVEELLAAIEAEWKNISSHERSPVEEGFFDPKKLAQEYAEKDRKAKRKSKAK